MLVFLKKNFLCWKNTVQKNLWLFEKDLYIYVLFLRAVRWSLLLVILLSTVTEHPYYWCLSAIAACPGLLSHSQANVPQLCRRFVLDYRALHVPSFCLLFWPGKIYLHLLYFRHARLFNKVLQTCLKVRTSNAPFCCFKTSISYRASQNWESLMAWT